MRSSDRHAPATILLSALILTALLAACSDSPLEVVNHAVHAIESGDLKGALADVATDYGDPLGGKDQLAHDLEDLHNTFGRITLHISETSESAGVTRVDAHTVGRLDAELESNPTVVRFTGPLDIQLRRENGFMIRGGLLADLRDVLKLMRARRAALEGNDVDAYVRLLHSTYRDGDSDLEDTRKKLEHDLPGARIRMEPTLYKIEARGLIIHVDEHYLLHVNDRALPASVARFTLRRSAGLWRISAGLYPDHS